MAVASTRDRISVVVKPKQTVLINQSGLIAAKRLSDLLDVDVSNKQNGSLLIYNENEQKFLADIITFSSGENTGITTISTANTVIISGIDASDTVKGVASFDITDFTVDTGNVTINTEHIQDIIFDSIRVPENTGIGINYDDISTNTFIITGIDASTTVKGVAKFNGLTDTGGVNQFSVSSGDVRIVSLDGGSF